MREELRDPGRLEHILASIGRINSFVQGHAKKDLEGDSQLFYAVVKNLEIIGEAAYMLSPAFKENHPDTPCKRIIGLRHILVHDYYQVDADELWNIIAHDLLPLQSQIQAYKKEIEISIQGLTAGPVLILSTLLHNQ